MNKNPVKQPNSSGVPVSQWLEHPSGVTGVVGLIPSWKSKTFSVVPSSVAKQPITSKLEFSLPRVIT